MMRAGVCDGSLSQTPVAAVVALASNWADPGGDFVAMMGWARPSLRGESWGSHC